MKFLFKSVLGVLALLVVGISLYGAKGYFDALDASARLAARADQLIKNGRAGADLGNGRLEQLLRVQDPAFYEHSGIDLSSKGAGLTTVTQSLSKRLAFNKFRPGIGKIRQTAYAFGLERNLSKEQIMALFLDTVEMGNGPDGWMTGFFHASIAIKGRPAADIEDHEFISLLAVMIAPGSYNLMQPDNKLKERTARIKRLIAGECEPEGTMDVWLAGCVVASQG